MELISRSYKEGDYESYIQKPTKENMEQHFIENFGGWSDEVSKKKFLEVIETGYSELFFQGDQFIGYVSFNEERDDRTSYMINDIHITKKHQRKGYGKQILNYVINKAKETNHKKLKLFVFKDNPSINFYIKYNFKETAVIDKSKTSVMTLEI